MITERIILANSDDDDLYSGYNEFHPALDPKVNAFNYRASYCN